MESAKLTASDGFPQDSFGSSVGLDGPRALIGVPGAQPSDRGAAYIFELEAGAWHEVAKLQPLDGRPVAERFGVSVALSGDIAAGGAPDDNEIGPVASRSGSAYVFLRDRAGVWTQVLKLAASDGLSGDRFGTSVSLSSTTAIVGAPTSGPGDGGAYVCELDSVNATSGVCRRQIPDVSELISMSNVTTSCCDASQFVITATFTNTSEAPIAGFFLEVGELTGGNLLLNADDGPAAVRATLTPDVGDGTLSPGEAVTVRFIIGLASQERFIFWVYPRGEPQR